MAQDRADFQETAASQLRGGGQPQIAAIIINPLTGGPGGSPMQLGQSYPVNFNPCDGLWLPGIYDASLGLNPQQQQPDGSLPDPYLFGGSYSGNGGQAGLWGINAWDLWDQSQAAQGNSGLVQAAAVFALQFNSTSAPWLVWSLSDFLKPDVVMPVIAPAPTSGGLVGFGDAMRSVSGPISSMNVKYLQWASAYDVSGQGGIVSVPASRIVLLSTIGLSQQTLGSKQNAFASAGLGAAGTAWPQQTLTPTQYGVGSGGYVQTNINTLERETLRSGGLGTSRRVGNG